jgi:hypothetical protein
MKARIERRIHIGLRPVGRFVDGQRKTAEEVEVGYRLRVVCREKEQGLIRTILLRHVDDKPMMTLQGIALEAEGSAGSKRNSHWLALRGERGEDGWKP